MKKLLGLAALLAISSLPTMAQSLSEGGTPALEIGGGYGFRSWGIPPADGSRVKQNGWVADANYNLTNHIGIAFDATGTRDSGGSTADDSLFREGIYSFTVGPRFYPIGHHKLTPFVHAMAGLGHYTLFIPSQPNPAPPPATLDAFNYSENHLAVDFGGGVDATVNSRVAIRLGEVDYERTVFTLEEAAPAQNNFRFSAGVIVRLGSR